MKRIVLATGGFDPLHSGHIDYLYAAKRLGDQLIVGLNSDDWLIRKKGAYFLPWQERFVILSHLKEVDGVVSFNDSDDTAVDAIKEMLEYCEYTYRHQDYYLIFANGGDRSEENIPELEVYKKYGRVSFQFGVGGNTKTKSSSEILDRWANLKAKQIIIDRLFPDTVSQIPSGINYRL